jgi:hypothetical protein
MLSGISFLTSKSVERELKRLILCFTHWIEASTLSRLRSKPHEYWRWLDHTITYTIFKKEMRVKSSLEIPLVHIASVRADSEAARGWYHGIRMSGTNVPRVVTAGTFYQDGKRVFWDVHHPEKTIVIDLHDERYNELVVEVDDPEGGVKPIQNAL